MKTITLTIHDHDSGKRVSRQFCFEHARQYRLGSEAYLAEEMKHAMHDLDVANEKKCGCRECNPSAWWMVVCSICGNKRCPRATNHEHECTNSNEPGQEGSTYM
jgi:hypothetical protein